MKTLKRWVPIFLLLAMIVATIPITVLAEEAEAQAREEERISEETEAVMETHGEDPRERENEALEESEDVATGRVQAMSLMAEGPGTQGVKKGTITAKWNHYSLETGFYNPADKGKEVELELYILAKGKNAEGNEEKFWFMYNPVTEELFKPTRMKVGDTYKRTIPLDRMELPNGKVYTDIHFVSADLSVDRTNRIYGASYSNQPAKNIILFQFSQNMQTLTTLRVAPGTTIPDEDKAKMQVRYTIEVSKDGGPREKVKGNPGKVLEEIKPFREGELDFVNVIPTGSDAKTFRRAVYQNVMNPFNPYSGKYKEFYLCPEWTGEHKEELEKHYKLDVEGNDLDGWTVTVTKLPNDNPTKPDEPSVPTVKERVVFDANGGAWANGDVKREYLLAEGSLVTMEVAPVREGYRFLYWKGSAYEPGDRYTVPAGGHVFTVEWKEEKASEDPSKTDTNPSGDKVKTPSGRPLTAEEIARILGGMKKHAPRTNGTKKDVPAIPKAGVGRAS